MRMQVWINQTVCERVLDAGGQRLESLRGRPSTRVALLARLLLELLDLVPQIIARHPLGHPLRWHRPRAHFAHDRVELRHDDRQAQRRPRLGLKARDDALIAARADPGPDLVAVGADDLVDESRVARAEQVLPEREVVLPVRRRRVGTRLCERPREVRDLERSGRVGAEQARWGQWLRKW